MNRVSSSLKAAVFAFGNFTRTAMSELALVPYYMSHLLWLIDRSFRSLSQKSYGGNAAVYAAIRLLITSVPEPPLIAYTRTPEGEPGEPLPWAHPLRQLIRQPNVLLTEYDLWEIATLHLTIVGISHWFKERDLLGNVIALWPLRPDRVGPIYARPDDYTSGRSDNPVLLGWSYQVPGTVEYLSIPRRDILTLNFPNPAGESGGIAEGLGPLQVLAAEVGADNEATRHVGSLIANHAIPGTVLQVPGKVTSHDDMLLIKRQFMQDFGGARRGEPMVADNGMTVTAMSFNLRDLEFTALRDVSESRITAALGTPAVLVGLHVGLTASSTNATVDQLRATFAETTLANYWRRFSDQFTNDVAAEFSDDLVCLFDMTKVRAFAAQAALRIQQVMEAYTNGAITRNELRDELGFPERADGDTYVYGIGAGRGMETPVTAAPDDDADQPGDDAGARALLATVPTEPTSASAATEPAAISR